MIKGAIFDIDGVLLDSMIIWTDLGERYLRSIGKEPEEGLTEKLFSMSMEQGAEYLKDTYNIDKIFTNSEVGVSKHEPDIYNLAAEYMGTDPSETLVFEDSLYALKTAKAAGYVTVGIYDAKGEKNQAGLLENAKLYLKSYEDLSGLVAIL